MNQKWVITNIGVLLLAGCFYLLTAASIWEDPATINTFGTTTGGFLWESRSLDLIIQFVAMFSGALGILALTQEVKE